MASERVRSNPEIAQHLANAFVRTLRYINTHTPEEIAAVIPVEISGKDRATYLRLLKEEIPMFETDGRMPADGAAMELKVLAAFNPRYASVAVGETYTNAFVDVSLRKLAESPVTR
jgi:NitT/TauT family transport system substrate-binding protein